MHTEIHFLNSMCWRSWLFFNVHFPTIHQKLNVYDFWTYIWVLNSISLIYLSDLGALSFFFNGSVVKFEIRFGDTYWSIFSPQNFFDCSWSVLFSYECLFWFFLVCAVWHCDCFWMILIFIYLFIFIEFGNL